MFDILKNKWVLIGGGLLILLIGVVIFFITRGGSSGSGSGPANLTVWSTFETSENMEPFIASYQEKYPNVQITYAEKNVDTYEEDLLNALASGSGPDIFAIHNDWLPKYADKLKEAPSKTLTIREYKDTFVDAAYNDFVLEGKVYAVPLSVDSLALYYNKDILGSFGIATPAKTWDELSEHARKITRSNSSGFFNRSGVAIGTVSNVSRAVDIIYLLILQNGTVPYTEDFSQSNLDSAVQDKSGNSIYPAAQALSFYTSFSNSNSENYNWNSRSNYSIDAFANSEAAYLYGYSYTRDAILQKSPNLNFDVTAAPQPNLDQSVVNFANYSGMAVSKQTKSSAVAWDFVKHMTNKDSLKSYYERHKVPSSRKDLISEQIEDPEIGVFAYANLTAKSFFKKDQKKVDAIIAAMVDSIVLRGNSIDNALSSAAQQINSLTDNFQ